MTIENLQNFYENVENEFEERDYDMVEEIQGSPEAMSEEDRSSIKPMIYNEETLEIIENTYSLLKITACVDTEYTDKKGLSIQAVIDGVWATEAGLSFINFQVIILDVSIKDNFSPEIIEAFEKKDIPTFVMYYHLNEEFRDPPLTNIISEILYDDYNVKGNTKIDMVFIMFYAVRDLTIAFGLKLMLPIYLGKDLIQKRCFFGSFTYVQKIKKTGKDIKHLYVVTVKDLSAIDIGSLKRVAAASGVTMLEKTKDTLNQYKKDMEIATKEKPLEFLEYGLADATVLYFILKAKAKSYNTMLKDIFDIRNEKFLVTPLTVPVTVGRVVSTLWDNWKLEKVWNANPCFILASAKQSVLNSEHPLYKQAHDYKQFLRKMKSKDQLETLIELYPERFEKMIEVFSKKGIFVFTPEEGASIKYLIRNTANCTLGLQASVTGGAICNRRPYQYYQKYVGDVDIKSAYGNQLVKTIFPIGIPTYFYKTANTVKPMLLGNFLENNKEALSNNLFRITASGRLSYMQTLIYSKLITAQQAKKKASIFEEGDLIEPVSGNFGLLTHEINNGSIIAPVINLMKKICSRQELNEFYNLEVESCIFYNTKDMVNTTEELIEAWLRDDDSYEYDVKQQTHIDKRSKAWYGIEIKDFIQPLVSRRVILKQLAKAGDMEAVCQDQSLKATINSFWGCTTSIYFPLNNVVVSDLIAGTTRVNVFIMGIPLNCLLAITDGGPYPLMEVIHLKKGGKKPSMATLSNFERLKKNRSVSIAPLGGIEWDKVIDSNTSHLEEPIKSLDKIATKHLQEFWARYGLKLDFEIEHKLPQTAKECSYVMKAHYIFRIWDPQTKEYTKEFSTIRGFRMEDLQDEDIVGHNPIYDLLLNMLNQEDSFLLNTEYQQKKLLKLETWRKSLKDDKDPYSSNFGKGVLPGDTIFQNCSWRLNNTYMYCATKKDFLKRMRRGTRKMKLKHETGEEFSIKTLLFEKYLKKHGIANTIKLMYIDTLRADHQNELSSSYKETHPILKNKEPINNPPVVKLEKSKKVLMPVKAIDNLLGIKTKKGKKVEDLEGDKSSKEKLNTWFEEVEKK